MTAAPVADRYSLTLMVTSAACNVLVVALLLWLLL